MSTFGIIRLLLSGLVVATVSAMAQPTVQVVWEAPSTTPLLDATGTALDSGLAAVGDGIVLELGYYDAGSASAPFAGNFVPLIGASSPDPEYRGTSVGDSGGGPNGTFSISANFNEGAVVFQGAPPVAGTPLVIRFFDAKTLSTAKFYNAVSGGANWQWKVPTEAPGSFVLLSLADSGLVWLGGFASSFRTTLPCPASFSVPVMAPALTSVSAVVGSAVTLTPPETTTPATYTAANLPSGLRLNTATGVVSGVPTQPGTHRVLVTLVNQAGVAETSLQYNISVAALSDGVVGSFSGLVERDSILNGNLGGGIQITTTSNGAYSGKLVVGSQAYVLRGLLGISAATPTQATISLPITALGVGVQLNLVFDGVSQTFSGTLTNGTQSVAVSGVQSPRFKTLLATKLTGAYAFRLQQLVPVFGSPQGNGVGTLNVITNSKTVTILATLADGARATFSTLLGKGGEVFVSGRGLGTSGRHSSVTGKLNLSLGTNAPVNNLLTGTLSWLKSAGDSTLYPSGFGPLSLDAAGGNLVPVAKGDLAMGLAPVSADAPRNAAFSFTSGGLDVEGLEFIRTVSVVSLGSSTNRVIVPSGTPTLTVTSISTSAGAFSGTFVLAGTTAATNRTVPFRGQIVPVGNGSEGYGFFVMPSLPGALETLLTSPKYSGSVLFSAP